MTFYHPNLVHLQQICAREFSSDQSRDFRLVRRLISFPALLDFAGFPLLRNQQSFNHKGDTGTSLSFFRHKDDGHWMFCCNNPQCGIRGDVIEFWYQLVVHIRLPSKDWSLPQAAGDLLARVESGEIDVSITEFEGASAKAHGHGGGEKYFSKLFALCQQNKNRKFVGESEALPTPVRMSVKEAILGLDPEDGLLMITPKREWHDIKMRDEWLRDYSKTKPPVPERSFISSNYLSRADMNCSYDGMEGVKRRWLVIEDDKRTLERQFWIHKELSRRHHNLNCVCYSGGKSLHGWYLVEDWTEKQCYELNTEAIGLGISDCRTFIICQPVRLPSGWNRKHGRKQNVLVWNL